MSHESLSIGTMRWIRLYLTNAWAIPWLARTWDLGLVLLASLLCLCAKLQSEMNANETDLICHDFFQFAPQWMKFRVTRHTDYIFLSSIFNFEQQCNNVPFVYKWKEFGFTVDFVLLSVSVVFVVSARTDDDMRRTHRRCHFTSNPLFVLDAC